MALRAVLGSAVLAFVLAGCGEEATTSAAPAASGSVAKKKVTAAAAPSASASAPATEEPPPVVDFQEADFAETERSRDPFRSFDRAFAEEARTRVKSQREVVLDQYSVEELKLVGIVTRIQPERALVIDPTGKGHIVLRGQFLGRAELVQAGGSGAEYEINWRVERIRDSDIVLVRDDPSNPDIPSATRIIPLRNDQLTQG